jgi:DNA recombination protein RmuC
MTNPDPDEEQRIVLIPAILAVIIVLHLVLLSLIWTIRARLLQDRDTPQIEAHLLSFAQTQERGERAIRDEMTKAREETANHARLLRDELAAALRSIHDTFQQSIQNISTLQKNQLEGFSAQLGQMSDGNLAQLAKMAESTRASARQHRDELAASLKAFTDSVLQQMARVAELQKNQLDVFSTRLSGLTQSNEAKLDAMRLTIEQKLAALQEDNGKKLDLMRQTVDEKLQGTLEKRLGESFKLVGERLEQVHKGLGEMQSLATGVGDLKRVITNVKTRGTWGEVQLGNLLDQVLTPEQFAANVATREHSGERVEYVIRLPGRDENGRSEVWLPIDAKFPIEDYTRLMEATEKADPGEVETAYRALEQRVKACAREICTKYINPPKTTDFAILYLPIEGLYAEVVRRTGTVEFIQRDCRVTIAGPTTLWSILNSLQMGFRTLAIEKRASEVWKVLGAVKAEFGKFGGILDSVHKKLAKASNEVEDAARKSRTIERRLRTVEELPAGEARGLLGEEFDPPKALDIHDPEA